ncbi:hypothetical protein N7497_001028 [Penicillium chrysogenum]|nr:hypothetical protein N7497_001028 [Penicillium chrysogenum]
MCGAEVCLGIRIRQSGKVFLYSAGASEFWSTLSSQLLRGMKSASKRNSLMDHFERFWRSGGLAAHVEIRPRRSSEVRSHALKDK